MRPEKDLAALVWDALEFSCNAEVALGQATLEEYLAAGPTRWATERQMALIGEALGRKLPSEFRISTGSLVCGMCSFMGI